MVIGGTDERVRFLFMREGWGSLDRENADDTILEFCCG